MFCHKISSLSILAIEELPILLKLNLYVYF